MGAVLRAAMLGACWGREGCGAAGAVAGGLGVAWAGREQSEWAREFWGRAELGPAVALVGLPAAHVQAVSHGPQEAIFEFKF